MQECQSLRPFLSSAVGSLSAGCLLGPLLCHLRRQFAAFTKQGRRRAKDKRECSQSVSPVDPSVRKNTSDLRIDVLKNQVGRKLQGYS